MKSPRAQSIRAKEARIRMGEEVMKHVRRQRLREWRQREVIPGHGRTRQRCAPSGCAAVLVRLYQILATWYNGCSKAI